MLDVIVIVMIGIYITLVIVISPVDTVQNLLFLAVHMETTIV